MYLRFILTKLIVFYYPQLQILTIYCFGKLLLTKPTKKMKLSKLITLALFTTLLFTCENDVISTDESIIKVDSQSLLIKSAKAELLSYIRENNITPKKLELVTSNSKSKSSSKSIVQGTTLSNIKDSDFYKSVVANAINGDDYECGPTDIDSYIGGIIQDWDNGDFQLYYYFGGVAFDYVYVFENENGGQYYGTEGQDSNKINSTFKDLLRFWNIPTDILLRDAHGSVYNDVEKVKSVLMLYGYPEGDAVYFAGLLQVVYGSDKYFNFNHPLLTFNAFAAPASDFFGTPKKIVMGDGILKAYEDLGFDDVAPQTILAHEYGHHIQFAKGVAFQNTPEGTRRTELMADAFAAYYLTHKRGATMNWKRVQKFLETQYLIGDCQFGSPNHHGTPNQRMKAATFGYDVANDTKKKGKILTAEEFIILFDAELPTIIESDVVVLK